MLKNYVLSFLFICFALSFGYGQNWTEDFNNNTQGYGTGTININGRTWTRSDAGNFGYGTTIMGNRAFVINDDRSGAHITTPVLNTCGTVTFDYAYVNGDSANIFELQVSTDGINFTTVDTRTLGATSNQSYVTYSYNINNSSATTYVRLLSDNQDAHLFIDNFSVTDFVATGPTVTYNGNGNTGGSVPNDTNNPYTSGDTVTVLGNTGSLTNTCSTFNNWNTAVDGSGTTYSSGNTFMITANTILYAQWLSTGNTVTFNNNGGSGTMAAQTDCVAANLTANSFTNAGFTFNSWNTAANGSGATYADGSSYNFAANITLYAQWDVFVGPCLSDNFDSGYGNWTGGSGTYNNATAGNTGNGIGFNTNNDDIVTASALSNPSSINFIARASGTTSNYTINIQYSNSNTGPWTLATSIVANGSNSGDITNTSNTFNLALGLTGNYYLRIVQTPRSGGSFYLDDVDVYCGPAGPEIEILGNSTEIVDGDVTPDTADGTDFGNVAVVGDTNTQTFTILNTGDADLNVTNVTSNNTEFAITGTTSGIIAPSNLITFTVTFDPNALGTRTAMITVNSDDADEGTYTFDVAGVGTNSNTSDIIVSSTYTYNSNIDYLLYQAATINNTGQSIDVIRFDIRDGGASNDADNQNTELTEITFNVTNLANIRTAALFDGNALIDNNPTFGAGTLSFSGFSQTALDGGTASLTLRVTFLNTVTDNDQITITIDNATANPSGSIFGNPNAGGATSSTLNNRNRIEVIADRLNFLQQPSDTNTNAIMSPSVEIEATDINANRDLDWVGNINLISSGTMTGNPLTVASTNSVSSFNSVVHTAAGTNLNLTATATGLSSAISSNFDITLFVFNTGDFRPLFATSFDFNGQWEYFNGSVWITAAGSGWDGNSPQNTSTNINRILIDDYVTGAASSSTNYDCDIIILAGGTLDIVDNDNNPPAEFLSANNTLEVKENGELLIRGDIDLANSTNLIVRSGGRMVIDQNSMNNQHPIWDGIEKFEGGSMLEINDWDWTITPSRRSLINVTTAITNNDNGYKFGNVYFNPANLTSEWTIVGGPISVNVTENNFEINNNSNFFVLGMSNRTSGISSIYNGDFIVSDGNFTFGGSFSNDTYDQDITIRGDVIINNDDDFYVHHAFNGTPTIASGSAPVIIEGNLEVWGLTNTVTSDVTTKEIIFSGDNTHTIEVAPNCSNVPFIIESGETAFLVNENLKFTGNSSLEIETNGTFNFSFNGATALEVQNISGGGNRFLQQSGAYLFITHPQGIWDSGNNGNVEGFATTNTTYNQANSTYHYIGNTNQQTGNAFTTGSTAKTIICELANNADELTVTTRTGTTNILDIRNGIVVNTDSNHIYGSGNLNISNGGLRSSAVTATGLVPLLTGSYNLTGGFVQLNAGSNQVLRGSRAYRDLIFSTSGTKTVSSAPSSIIGTILVEDAAVLDVESNTMGGNGTFLTMTGTSEYITGGVGVKPDALETYNLGVGTKITFVNDNTSLQGVRLFRDYYNIDIEGSNVGTSSATLPVRIQSGGTFTVKPTGVFKFINTDGFNGSNLTAIDNTNNPSIVLETGSTIEYAGDTQTLTEFLPNYSNVIISGTGIKALGTNAGIVIGENLNVMSSTELQIADSKFVQVQDNISNNGTISVSNQGALVQVDDLGTYTSNPATGINTLSKLTSPLQYWYDYTYWSSPLQNAQIEIALVDSSPVRRYYFDASEFNDILEEDGNTGNFNPGHDDIDDEGNDWTPQAVGTMISGVGYAATHSSSAFPFANVPYNYIFEGNPSNSQGGFNTGDIDLDIYITPAVSTAADFNNWNLIGNPYPSAINAATFFSETSSFLEGVIYLWSQVTDADANTSGNEGNNFSQDDYAILNYLGGIASGSAAPNDPGNIPNGYIASGQGFFVIGNKSHATAGEGYYNETVFNNSMRAIDNNTQFFRSSNNATDNKLWVNLTSDNGVFSQILVGYVDNASDGVDSMAYDALRNLSTGSSSLLYSLIDESEKKYAIQGKSSNSLNIDEVIPLGFYTSIDIPTIYTLSLAQFEGEFLSGNSIYLIDNLTNDIHDLSFSDYTFSSETGEFNNRFQIVFNTMSLSIDDNLIDANTLRISELKNGQVQFSVGKVHTITNVAIIDVTGRHIYNLKGNASTEVYNLSQLSKAPYIAKVTLSNGQTISKKAIKQR